MKHETHGPTKINGATAPRGLDGAQRRSGWSEEDERRATDPYVAPQGGRTEARSPDVTQRQKPYIVEAMAPPSVPPMVPDRSGIPDDARTDVATSDDVPRPQDPNEFGAHGDLPPDAGH